MLKNTLCLKRKKHYDVSIVNIKMTTGTKTCLKRKQRETRAGFYSDRQINNNGNHYWVSSLMMTIRGHRISFSQTPKEKGQESI